MKNRCLNISYGSDGPSPRVFWARSVYSLFFLLLLLPIAPATVQSEDINDYRRLFDQDPASPWQLQADDVSYDSKTGQYRASGNVVIRQVDKTLSADHVSFNATSMKMSAGGNVVLKVGEDVLQASRVEIDLKEDRGVLYDGEVFLDENHFHIKGDKVEQVSRYSYAVENAVVTTCDDESPAWKITGKRVDVTLNGYGFVKQGTLWAKGIPVFYVPWLVFPAKLDRQTGFLTPEMGLSDRRGTEYDQPFFWAVNQSADATFYDHYMSERGNKIGAEYRYARDRQSKGTIMADFLDDLKIDDGTARATSKYGYDHDAFPRTNSDRYWFRMKADQALGNGFLAKLDADIVSDQDFLIEFRDSQSGYFEAKDYYLKSFGRMLDAYEDPVRVNRLNVNRIGSFYSFNTDLKWYDDIIARRWGNQDTSLQNLPQMTFNAIRQRIADLPLYWDMASEYTYFYSEDGSNGHRMDVHPKIYVSALRNKYFTLEPSMGFRETAWQMDTFQDHPMEADKEKTNFRYLVDTRLDLRSEAYRIYPMNGSRVDAVKHTIVPQIVYDYIPEVNQDEYPWFDELDDDINRVDQTNEIAFVLTNFWTARSKSPAAPDPGKRRPKTPFEQYQQVMRFEIKQGYDIHEATANHPADYRNQKDKQPFLPLETELELRWADFLSVTADSRWNHYDDKFYTQNIELGLWNLGGHRFYTNYRFTEDLVESWGGDIVLKLTDRLHTYVDYQRNLSESRTLETSLGFLYGAQCYSLDMRFKEDEDDRKVQFMVNLKGLGEDRNK